MWNDKHVSNVYIDTFVEKISYLGVSKDDVDDFLHRSMLYEITEDVYEKMGILDSIMFDFECRYPELYQTLDDDVNQVYFENRVDF